ncbi:MAG: MBL fold metallo-hydrolase [Acidimicrobiales bacterium]
MLGCSGGYPSTDCACSGYLVQSADTTLWLDAGPGTLANLQRHVPLEQVDAVVLSHEHPDHWTDLEGFNVACRYVLHRSGDPVAVLAPGGLRQRTHEPDTPALGWQEVGHRDRVEIGDLALSFSRTDHPPTTLAVRVDRGGSSLGYSADSGPGWSLEALGPGLGLALCEATFTSKEEAVPVHLSARQAGETARAAGVERLVLTHLWPLVDPERCAAEGSEGWGSDRSAEVASVGAVFEV